MPPWSNSACSQKRVFTKSAETNSLSIVRLHSLNETRSFSLHILQIANVIERSIPETDACKRFVRKVQSVERTKNFHFGIIIINNIIWKKIAETLESVKKQVALFNRLTTLITDTW